MTGVLWAAFRLGVAYTGQIRPCLIAREPIELPILMGRYHCPCEAMRTRFSVWIHGPGD